MTTLRSLLRLAALILVYVGNGAPPLVRRGGGADADAGGYFLQAWTSSISSSCATGLALAADINDPVSPTDLLIELPPEPAEKPVKSKKLWAKTPFSQEWVKALVADPPGCSSWRTVGYIWQDTGFAGNFNRECENKGRAKAMDLDLDMVLICRCRSLPHLVFLKQSC